MSDPNSPLLTDDTDDFSAPDAVAPPTPWDPKFPDHVIEPLIEEYCGNITAVARQLGVKRRYLQDRINIRPSLASALKDAREEICDVAEQNVFARVRKGGNPSDDRFVLSCLGKDRGYSTRVEATGKNGTPFSITIEGADADL